MGLESFILSLRSAQSGSTPEVLTTLPLLIVAGQSNAEKGAIFVSVDLPGTHDGVFHEVKYYGDDGVFRSLDSSDQDAYQAPLDASDRFAFQFSLYPQLAAQIGCNSVTPLIVCSVSIGDTDMATEWNPNTPGTLFADLIARVNACKALVTSTYGMDLDPVYCLWDQGEKDGRDTTKAAAHEARIYDLVEFVRTQTGLPNIRYIMPLLTQASINASPNPVTFGATINNDKRNQLSVDDALVITVDCNDCEPSTDGVHFTWAGQLNKADLVRQAMVDRGWIPGTPTVVPTNQTVFTGYSTRVRFGDTLDSLFAAVDAVFRLGVTVWKPSRYGFRTLVSKFNGSANQRSFHWLLNGDSITFNWYRTGASGQVRGVSWTGMLSVLHDGDEHTLEIRYNGALDTNNGLDRPALYVDGSLYTTGKSLTANSGSLGDIFNGTAQLAVGGLVNATDTSNETNFWWDGYMREFFVQNSSVVDEIRVVNLLTGTDSSGNGRNGTYVLA